MGLRLVNNVPGALDDPLVPGRPFYLGLRSESAHVDPTSLNVMAGLTSLTLGLSTPDQDAALARHGASVAIETTERRRPQSGSASASIVSNSLHIEKTDDLDANYCVFEISHPIPVDASILGYFKIRTSTSWTPFDPDWIDYTDMSGVYLGLEHGGFNTALYTFLRTAGTGSLVVGGPLSMFGGARPEEQEFTAFAWGSLADDTVVEIWIFFNAAGYPAPFATPNVPLVEVWTKRAGVDTVPVVHAFIPVSTLGEFPVSGFRNSRLSGDGKARLYIGNAGRTGDLLKVDDFALYPDFRLTTFGGVARSGSRLTLIPNAPGVYRSADGLLPRAIVPGRWLPDGISPDDSLRYVSPQASAVRHMSITKSVSGRMAYRKQEPRLEANAPVSSQDGAMIEAFIAGASSSLNGVLFGGGIAIDDGQKLFQTGMVSSGDTVTHSLLSVLASQTSLSGHYLPTEDSDYRTLKLLRLVVDRRRSKVAVFADENKIIEKSLSDTFPNSEGAGGKVRFGHVFNSTSHGRVDVRFVNYLSRYLAYESEDGDLPTAADVPFLASTTSDASGSSLMVDDVLRIKKASYGGTGSKRIFTKTHPFSDVGGFLCDFRARVLDFTDETGLVFPDSASTGVGLDINIGAKRVRILFVNCGVFGKKIAVLPGSGTIDDIISQTALGRAFSASVDWTEMRNYRLVYRARAALELWATSVVNAPVLSVPWRNNTDGFDLSTGPSSNGIRFGHLDGAGEGASTSEWEHLRWGNSDGYDVTISTEVPELLPYLFSGRSLIVSAFDE